MRKFYLLLLVLINVCIGSMAQQKEGANWLFGGFSQNSIPGTHLDFNYQNPLAVPFNYDYNWASGVATISDKKGQLLFFSSFGHIATRVILNGKYQEMPNGHVLGNSIFGTMAELIVQSPADENVYYLFLVSEAFFSSMHDLYVVQVDMRLNNGYGDVVPNSLRLVKKNVSASMAALLHSNNRDTWVLFQNAAGDTIQTQLLGMNGLSSPVTSITNKLLARETKLKSSPSSDLLVFTGAQGVELFNFNRSTGFVSHSNTLTIPNSTERGFSYAFSPDQSKLYVGTTSIFSSPIGTCSIGQFNLAAGNLQQIQQSFYEVYRTVFSNSIWDLQLAIDGKIYVSHGE